MTYQSWPFTPGEGVCLKPDGPRLTFLAIDIKGQALCNDAAADILAYQPGDLMHFPECRFELVCS